MIPPAVEPGHSPQQEAKGDVLLLVVEHLHVGQPGGVIDGGMDLLIACFCKAAKPPITGDAVADALKAGQLLLLRKSLRLVVNMDDVAGLGPLAEPHRRRRLQVFEPPNSHCLELAAHS